MGRPSGPKIVAGVGKVWPGRKNGPAHGGNSPKTVTPEMMTIGGDEHGHQAALIVWADTMMHRPGYEALEWLFAIPNGGERSKAVAGRMKAEGVRSGVFDLCLPVARGGYFGLFIEMKKPKGHNGSAGGTVSDKQKDFKSFVYNQGYAAVVCWGWEQARAAIELYLSWPQTTPTQERMTP